MTKREKVKEKRKNNAPPKHKDSEKEKSNKKEVTNGEKTFAAS